MALPVIWLSVTLEDAWGVSIGGVVQAASTTIIAGIKTRFIESSLASKSPRNTRHDTTSGRRHPSGF
ncbi:hypothetical protein D3C86_2073840 [compost metagenome]